jgi:hypothetical protein
MNATRSLSALALLIAVSGAALADDPTPDTYRDMAPSGKTRAEVQAELQQARLDGSIKVWSNQYNPLTVAKSLRSREAVRAEVIAARNAGELNALNGEDSGSAYLAAQGSRAAAPLLAGSPVKGQ